MHEGIPQEGLPEQITLTEDELKLNSEGKRYLYEKEGVYYGGDYLAETPSMVDITDLPPKPEEEEPTVL